MIATIHCTTIENAGVSYFGCTCAKCLKNKPSFAIAYSILGWNIIQLESEPITTIIAIIATMTPAALPINGILDANKAIGASEAASSSTDNKPDETTVRLTYNAKTITAVKINPFGKFLPGSFISPDI